MKICPNCGAQYDDAINFCSACGTATVVPAPVAPAAPEQVQPVAPVAPVAAPAKPASPVLGFIGKLLSVLAAMFIGCGLASAYLDINVYLSSYSYDLNGYGYFEPDEGCSILALLLSLGALALSVVAFIQALVKKAGTEKILAAIVQMTVALATIIVSITMLANI